MNKFQIDTINYNTKNLLNGINHTNYYHQKVLKPKVSFIIPVFNKQKFLTICIKSIQNQLLNYLKEKSL